MFNRYFYPQVKDDRECSIWLCKVRWGFSQRIRVDVYEFEFMRLHRCLPQTVDQSDLMFGYPISLTLQGGCTQMFRPECLVKLFDWRFIRMSHCIVVYIVAHSNDLKDVSVKIFLKFLITCAEVIRLLCLIALKELYSQQLVLLMLRSRLHNQVRRILSNEGPFPTFDCRP